MTTLEYKAKKYCECNKCPDCNNCEYITEEQESCANRLQYEAYIDGAKLHELHIANLIFLIEEFLSEDNLIRHSNSFNTLKSLVGL